MSDEQLQPVSNDTNSAGANGPRRRSGLMRAVLYTPVAVLLGGLAALATFPELARYATPIVGEAPSSSNSCPISALANRMGCGSCPSKSSADMVNAVLASAASTNAPAACCSTSAVARFSCCGSAESCPTEKSQATESPVADSASSAEPLPADAFAAANAEESDTASN